MLLAISMPQWLVDFWAIYGGQITPVLVTLLTLLMTWFSLKIKKDNATNIAKTDAQILVMKQLVEKDDNKRELNAIELENKELRNSLALVGDMIVELSKNINIDPEAKDKIENLGNKSKYGTGLQIIEDLQNKNQQLTDVLKIKEDELSNIVKSTTPKVKETIKKIRN